MGVMVSICMPVYEAGNYGVSFLKEGLNSIEKQTFKDFEIIISDHSKDDKIKNLCREFSLPIKYIKFQDKYNNGPANTNNSIKYASGKYIKILFQDDFFKSEFTLEKMVDRIENSSERWIASSCDHCGIVSEKTNRVYTPIWGELTLPTTIDKYINIKPGIGSPSLIMYERSDDLVFNEDLIVFMDVDFYYNLTKKYSKPIIMLDVLVTIRIWCGSISSTTGAKVNIKNEEASMIEKYKGKEI